MLSNTYIWTIITVFTIALEWFILSKVLLHTSTARVSKFKVNTSLYIVILFSICMNLVGIFPNLRVIISICITAIFYKYICGEKIIKVSIVSLLYWMILLGIDAFSMSFIVWINNLDSMDFIMGLNVYRLQVIILAKGILVLASICYCKIKITLDISKRDVGYIFIPIITNILSFLVIYKYVIEVKNVYVLTNKELMIISFLLVLSNICLILYIRKTIIANRIIAEGNLIKEKMKMQYTHYVSVQEDHMKVRQLHHDIKNHIACIKGVAQINNDATNYISSIESELDKYDNSFNTGNIILDIILNEKSKTCKESDIKLLIDINNFGTCDFIDTIDVCSIFSNILDNSIEACEKIKDMKKEIILRGTIVNDFFVIRIENTKQNKVNIREKHIKTDKKDIYLHGLGIKSVKSSVEKYSGEVVIDYNENRFVMKIIIPLVPK